MKSHISNIPHTQLPAWEPPTLVNSHLPQFPLAAISLCCYVHSPQLPLAILCTCCNSHLLQLPLFPTPKRCKTHSLQQPVNMTIAVNVCLNQCLWELCVEVFHMCGCGSWRGWEFEACVLVCKCWSRSKWELQWVVVKGVVPPQIKWKWLGLIHIGKGNKLVYTN